MSLLVSPDILPFSFIPMLQVPGEYSSLCIWYQKRSPFAIFWWIYFQVIVTNYQSNNFAHVCFAINRAMCAKWNMKVNLMQTILDTFINLKHEGINHDVTIKIIVLSDKNALEAVARPHTLSKHSTRETRAVCANSILECFEQWIFSVNCDSDRQIFKHNSIYWENWKWKVFFFWKPVTHTHESTPRIIYFIYTPVVENASDPQMLINLSASNWT